MHHLNTEKSNKAPLIYSAEEIKNISSLTNIFKGIRARLKDEGTSFEIEKSKLLNKIYKKI